MKLRNWSTLGLGTLCSLSLLGCSNDSDGTDGASDDIGGGSVEIFSWWTSGGESDALQAVLDIHKERIPKASVTNAAVDFADKAREKLQDRMEKAIPPDTFQANIGADLFKWVLLNGNDDSETKVESLQKLAEENGWLDVFDPDILAAASHDGKLYGLPVNVHRINSLFIRKDLFEKHGLTAPTSLEELHTVCDTIMNDADIQAEAPGGRMACLALGNKWSWTLGLVGFQMVMPAIAGPEYFESFWLGNESASDAELQDTLDETLYLYCGGTDTSDCANTTYFNQDIDDVTWDVAVQKLVSGDAMMAPMGDWAKGLLDGEGLEPGVDYEVVPFPGSDGTYIFTADTFALPKGAPNRAGAIELLKTFASKEGQIAFNKLKGSIPTRTDVEATEFDEVTQATIESFATSTKARALSGILPTDVMTDLDPELKASVQAGSTDIVFNYITANYDSLNQ